MRPAALLTLSIAIGITAAPVFAQDDLCATFIWLMRPHLLLRRLLLAIALLIALPVSADQINIAVAANFLGTLQQLAAQFQQATGHELVISSASSGQLYTQIKQGAPFDVFLSADSERPQQLESEGLGVAGSRITYAIGTLVLWSPQPDVVDAGGKVLQSGHIRMLAVADPKNAPYGAAAQQVLTALGLWEPLNQEHKIAMAENINQAWQFAATGNAELAFIAKSQLHAPTAATGTAAGSSWEPPQSMYGEIDQDGIVLTRTQKRAVAEAFMQWLHHDARATATIIAAGYRIRE
jgi:molybdate transport system substrate-binding protein